MSHTIIYNRLFIKATDKDGQVYIVPMIQAGSNNCTQMSSKGREIRERSWEGWKYFTKGKLIGTEQEILQNIDEDRLERMKDAEESVKKYKDDSWAYDDKRYGYHSSLALSGRSTTFSAFRSSLP